MSSEKKLLFLTSLLAFLAPSGIFYLPIEMLGTFRFFYIILFLFNICFLFSGNKVSKSKSILILILMLVLICSATYGYENIYILRGYPISKNPLIRMAVIINLMFGFYFLSFYFKEHNQSIEKFFEISFISFVIVFFVGLILYINYIFHTPLQDLYLKIVTVQQEAYGYTRFSPGTYPNEFGVLSSFYTIYSYLIYKLKKRKRYIIFMSFFLVGIALSSTRIAYMTFLCSLAYIIYKSNKKFINIVILSFCLISIIITLSYIGFDFISVFQRGFSSLINNQGSSETRIKSWQLGLDYLLHHPFMGTGFESPISSMLHNLPVQLLTGLGLPLFYFVFLLFVVLFSVNRSNSNYYFFDKNKYAIYKLLKKILLIHVVLFGLTNHNQTHFLTWICFGLYLLKFNLIEFKKD